MDLQSRKLKVISYLIDIQDEKVLDQIEAAVIGVRGKRKVSTTTVLLTPKQIVERAKKSNDDYQAGRVRTQEQLEKESEMW
jgi:hypothetical protein